MKCSTCETQFAPYEGSEKFWHAYCPPCVDAMVQKRHMDALSNARNSVRCSTPERFQRTNIDHEDFNRSLWNGVQDWCASPEVPWVGICGPTGMSKTRCAYLLFEKMVLHFVRNYKDPAASIVIPTHMAASAYQIGDAIATRFLPSSGSIDLDEVRNAEILLLDDLGKQRNTPSVAAGFFDILDFRHAHNNITIWTSNSSPEGIARQMDDHLRTPFAGRLRECSTIFNVRCNV